MLNRSFWRSNNQPSLRSLLGFQHRSLLLFARFGVTHF